MACVTSAQTDSTHATHATYPTYPTYLAYLAYLAFTVGYLMPSCSRYVLYLVGS
jgi:hypothetical protein